MADLFKSRSFSRLIYTIFGLLLAAVVLVVVAVVNVSPESEDLEDNGEEPIDFTFERSTLKESFVISAKEESEIVTSSKVVLNFQAGAFETDSDDSISIFVTTLVNPSDFVVCGQVLDAKRPFTSPRAMIDLEAYQGKDTLRLNKGYSVKVEFPTDQNMDYQVLTQKGQSWIENTSIVGEAWGMDDGPAQEVSEHAFAYEGDKIKGQKLFEDNCSSCHALKQVRTGPALSGVTNRLDREWLISWIKNSRKVIDSGDPYANKIYAKYKSDMTTFEWMEEADIVSILTFIEQSGGDVQDTSSVEKHGAYLAPLYWSKIEDPIVLANSLDKVETYDVELTIEGVSKKDMVRVVVFDSEHNFFWQGTAQEGLLQGTREIQFESPTSVELQLPKHSGELNLLIMTEGRGGVKLFHKIVDSQDRQGIKVDLIHARGEVTLNSLKKVLPIWASI